MSLKYVSVFILLFSIGFISSASARSVEEAVSIKARADGLFDVTCKNGYNETVSADEIRGNFVCSRKPTQFADCEDRSVPGGGLNYFACGLSVVETRVSNMAPPRKVPDVLWAIDDSGSMAEEQLSISQSAQAFANSFLAKNKDWKLGIVTTDVQRAPALGFATAYDANTTDYLKVFADAVLGLGTAGSATESPFDSILAWLKQYPSFLRASSELAVVIVTDALDQSKITAKDFLAELTKLKGDSAISIHGIISAEDLGCMDGEREGPYAGSKFDEVITATKGTVAPLCKNVPLALENVGAAIELQAGPVSVAQEARIDASQVADPTTLAIYYNGQKLVQGPKGQGVWDYDAQLKHIVFWDSNIFINPKKQILILFQ